VESIAIVYLETVHKPCYRVGLIPSWCVRAGVHGYQQLPLASLTSALISIIYTSVVEVFLAAEAIVMTSIPSSPQAFISLVFNANILAEQVS